MISNTDKVEETEVPRNRKVTGTEKKKERLLPSTPVSRRTHVSGFRIKPVADILACHFHDGFQQQVSWEGAAAVSASHLRITHPRRWPKLWPLPLYSCANGVRLYTFPSTHSLLHPPSSGS